MSWRNLFGKTRRGIPQPFVKTRSQRTLYDQQPPRVWPCDRSAWTEAHRQAEEDLKTTAIAVVWGLALGAGVALIVWICMQPVPG